MTDYGTPFRQRLIRPRLIDALWEFLTQPPDDFGLIEDDHLCGIDPNADGMYAVKHAEAIRKLGRCWRGRADAQHTYTNSLGVKTNPAALTEPRA